MQTALFPAPTEDIAAEASRLESTIGYDETAAREDFPTPYRFLPVEQIPASYQQKLLERLRSQKNGR